MALNQIISFFISYYKTGSSNLMNQPKVFSDKDKIQKQAQGFKKY